MPHTQNVSSGSLRSRRAADRRLDQPATQALIRPTRFRGNSSIKYAGWRLKVLDKFRGPNLFPRRPPSAPDAASVAQYVLPLRPAGHPPAGDPRSGSPKISFHVLSSGFFRRPPCRRVGRRVPLEPFAAGQGGPGGAGVRLGVWPEGSTP